MNIEDLAIFFGRFHPILVHLPIGFLIMAFLMWSFQKWKKSHAFDQAIAFCLMMGTISAALACVAGYLLSTSGGYEGALLSQHMWGGIITTLVAGLVYVVFSSNLSSRWSSAIASTLMMVMMVGLSFTGHIGGSLTHGSDFLTEYAPIFGSRANQLPPPASMEEVVLYGHVIQPILQEKCISCHRSDKLKGGLSLENPESIRKGGESGPLFLTSAEETSELIRRIHLPESNEEVMPPKGKSQLTEAEIDLLEAWIMAGVDFEKPLQSYGNDTIQNLAGSYLGLVKNGSGGNESIGALAAIDSLTLVQLRESGLVIRELLADSYRYDVSIPQTVLANQDLGNILGKLELIKDNIIWLNVSDLGLDNAQLADLTPMNNLEKLRLEKNKLTDKSISLLAKFPKLQVVNLYGNDLTDACLSDFQQLQKLEKVYVWQTKITAKQAGKVELVS
ncbi:c-type cytochrome domain-containing protein [Algoriphagus aquimarinus]|uniref:c-type cytochrome domain-containing protein n=1 Tax=Algoriphagus aquimarinus TaxID=237018 RepID=UPI0030D76FC7|tara:strand:+ start:115325 stop:116665 length:1341 start_codon:yes stop_codon:yes gene_type:complete